MRDGVHVEIVEAVERLATHLALGRPFARVTPHVGSEHAAIAAGTTAHLAYAWHTAGMANVVRRQLLLRVEGGFAVWLLAFVRLDSAVPLAMAHHVAGLSEGLATYVAEDASVLPAMATQVALSAEGLITLRLVAFVDLGWILARFFADTSSCSCSHGIACSYSMWLWRLAEIVLATFVALQTAFGVVGSITLVTLKEHVSGVVLFIIVIGA